MLYKPNKISVSNDVSTVRYTYESHFAELRCIVHVQQQTQEVIRKYARLFSKVPGTHNIYEHV